MSRRRVTGLLLLAEFLDPIVSTPPLTLPMPAERNGSSGGYDGGVAVGTSQQVSITIINWRQESRCSRRRMVRLDLRWRLKASSASLSSSFSASDFDSSKFGSRTDVEASSVVNSTIAFCIIEGPETLQDFAQMELPEIQDNIHSRRNKIFLYMEEVRRLRIQQRIKSSELGILDEEEENELPNFPSFIPFLPPLNATNLRLYYATCFSLIAGIMLFGGLLAPTSD